MGADARRPVPRTTGTRYCKGVRRRATIPYARLAVRHVGGRLVVLPRPSPEPTPRKAPRTGPVTAVVAVLALIVCVTLLLTGVTVEPPGAVGPCPARTSVTAVADGHSLRARREQTDDLTALVHLCAGPSLGPVRNWSIGLPETPGQELVAVQRLDDRLALAVAPIAADRRATLTVTTVPRTGPPITFSVRMSAWTPTNPTSRRG